MSQLNLSFKHRPALGREDFVVTESNSDAIAWFDRWPNWPNNALAIYGSGGSGKTHLVQCWASLTKGRVINGDALGNISFDELSGHTHIALDEASSAPEIALLQTINIFFQKNGSIFLVDRLSPAFWSVTLPDLQSRLRSISTIELKEPDDDLLFFLLKKLFSDRQIRISDEVIVYIVRRIERSFLAAQNFVAAIDELAFVEKRNITIPLVAKLFDRFGEKGEITSKR